MKLLSTKRRPPIHSKSLRRNKGLSLIELLIGIAIGLLVVAAAIGSLVYTRISSTTVGDSSRLQQEAATAFRVIGYHIRQGGARRVQAAPVGINVEFNPNFGGFGTPAAPIVVTGVDGAANAPDTLRISHDADPLVPVTDCLGNQAGAAVNNVTNEFSLVAGNLFCVGSGAIAGAALVQGVEDFQVWYGVRSTNDAINFPLQYRPSPVINAAIEQVESVMVCLRISGESTGNPGDVTVGCNGENVANDGRIRRTLFRVFNIRNVGL